MIKPLNKNNLDEKKQFFIDTIAKFCDKCGSTHVEQTDIETWKDMYKKKYGIDFVNNKPLKK